MGKADKESSECVSKYMGCALKKRCSDKGDLPLDKTIGEGLWGPVTLKFT